MNERTTENLLTLEDVAEIIGCTVRHVREVLVRKRGLKAIVIYNKTLRFRQEDLDNWLAKQARSK